MNFVREPQKSNAKTRHSKRFVEKRVVRDDVFVLFCLLELAHTAIILGKRRENKD